MLKLDPKKIVCALIALLVASCEPPRSAKPIGAQAPFDARLAGVWAARLDGGSEALLQIAPHPGGADLLLSGTDESGLVTMHFDVTAGAAGGIHYLNLREKHFASVFSDKFELGADYLFSKYELSTSGALTIWYMDDEVAKQAIEAGTLAGTTGPDFVRITDEPAKILELVAKADPAKLWSKLATFRHVKIVYPTAPPK